MAQPNASSVPTRKLGDANIFQASSLSNLSDLPTNGNLNIKTNIEDLHLYDQTILENSVLYSVMETVDITSGPPPGSTSSEGTNIFQFTTANWSNNREYVLEVPVVLTVELPGCEYYQQDPAYVNNIKAGLFFQNWTMADLWNLNNAENDYSQYKYDTAVVESFAGGFFPNEAVLQLFKSFQVYGGTNNQPLGRNAMFDQPNLCNQHYGKTSDEDAATSGYSGLPYSNVVKRGIKGSYNIAGTVVKYVFPNNGYELENEGVTARGINQKALSSFESTIRMCSSGCGGVNIGADPGLVNGVNPAIMKFQKRFTIPIPLHKLSEFFRLNISLPPAMVYKLTMKYYTKAIDVYVGSLISNRGLAQSPNNVDMAIFKMKIDTDAAKPQIKYRSFVLTPTLQDQLNQRWARNVITYNMETAENFFLKGTDFPYRTVISTSAQRPLNLRLCVVASRDSVIPADNKVPGVKYIENQLVPWLDKAYNYLSVTEIIVSISGRTVLSFNNLSPDQSGIIPTGFEFINSEMQRRCAKGYSGMAGANESMRYGTFTGGAAGVPIDICITPNMIWGNGYYPTDQGAVQIKLEIKTSSQLHPDFDIMVYKLYTQQLSLDTNINVTLTEWPSRVVQNQGISTLQQNSVIPGN